VPTNDQIILTQLLEERKREIAPELSEANYFELFCSEQILKDYDASYDEIEEGITGNGGDGGIDSIYLLINGEIIHEDTDLSIFKGDISIELHIIQSKKSTGFSEDAIHRLIASTSDLLDLSKSITELRQVYNSKLLSILEKFRESIKRFTSKLPNLDIHYYYATLGTEIHPNVERQVSRVKEKVVNYFSSAHFTFDFLGARNLLELARKQPAAVYSLKLAETPLSANYSFICLVRLQDYQKFITDDNGRYRRGIFDANVRDYQGNVEVNRAIRQTLQRSSDEDFWWLNNGITILATEVSHSGRTLTIKDPQVVNGLQTSHEIYRVFQEQSESSEDRSLLVRVITPQSDGSYQRIVKATNSQTNVPPASLRATDIIHRDIEDYLKSRGYYYERRKNYYKNEGRPREKIVSISYVAQAVMAILLARPDDARGRPSTLIKNDVDYEKVFSPQHPIEIYYICVALLKRIETYLRDKSLTADEVNNLKYHIAMFVARRMLNIINPTNKQIAKIETAKIDEKFIEACYEEVRPIYDKLGANDQTAKGKDFVIKLNESLDKLTHKTRFH
jgi:hypothetical protein